MALLFFGRSGGNQTVDGLPLAISMLFAAALDSALIALWFVIPGVSKAFAGADHELPRLTVWVLENYRWSALLVIVVSIALFALIQKRGQTLEQSRTALLFFGAVSIACAVALGVFVIAMYLPIFQLGNRV